MLEELIPYFTEKKRSFFFFFNPNNLCFYTPNQVLRKQCLHLFTKHPTPHFGLHYSKFNFHSRYFIINKSTPFFDNNTPIVYIYVTAHTHPSFLDRKVHAVWLRSSNAILMILELE